MNSLGKRTFLLRLFFKIWQYIKKILFKLDNQDFYIVFINNNYSENNIKLLNDKTFF